MCFLFYNNSPKVCCNQWHICEICSTIYFLIASLQPCKYHMAVHNVLCAKIVNSSVIRQKGESQNGCFKKTKHTKFSKKPNISYPLIRTRIFQHLDWIRRDTRIWIWRDTCFVHLKHPFWNSPFCLITDELRILLHEVEALHLYCIANPMLRL